MKRSGVISFDLLLGQPDLLSRYLLAYDELWVPGLKESYPDEESIAEWDLDREHLASMTYLESERFIREPPFNLSQIRHDEVTKQLRKLYQTASKAAAKAYPTAEKAALASGAATFNMDIALSRLVTYVRWRDHQDVVYPVVFPFTWGGRPPAAWVDTHTVLSVVLKRLPAPSEPLPLQDILAFKRDPDTQYKFARFWHWTRTIAKKNLNASEIGEEIDWLITDYSEHLKQLTKAVSYDRTEVLVSTPLEMLENLVKIRWSKMAKSLFSLGRKKIAAHRDELKLPGSEVAYLSAATTMLAGRYPAT
jgi:hypothetical protein